MFSKSQQGVLFVINLHGLVTDSGNVETEDVFRVIHKSRGPITNCEGLTSKVLIKSS